MSFKPVVLVYDLDNRLVDEIAADLGATGLYTTINTYNEANAMDAVRQYNRGFSFLTNKLSCVITGWNNFKKPRDQFLYRLRIQERGSPLRAPTPVIIVTEDHRDDLKMRALDKHDGNVCAYLHRDNFSDSLTAILHRVVFERQATQVNEESLAAFQAELAEREREGSAAN